MLWFHSWPLCVSRFIIFDLSRIPKYVRFLGITKGFQTTDVRVIKSPLHCVEHPFRVRFNRVGRTGISFETHCATIIHRYNCSGDVFPRVGRLNISTRHGIRTAMTPTREPAPYVTNHWCTHVHADRKSITEYILLTDDTGAGHFNRLNAAVLGKTVRIVNTSVPYRYDAHA